MNIKTGQGEISLMTLIAIWFISAIVSLPGLAVSPIMGDLTKIFPKVSDLEIQMLTSLPSALIIPFVLLAGHMAKKGHKNKIGLLYIGLCLFFACGILFFFAKNMTALIVLSSILGIGAGIIIPLSTGLVVEYFTGVYRTKQLGICSAINNLTLVIATAITGWLATINWHMPFIVYLIPGISILLTWFLRDEPPHYKTNIQNDDAKQNASHMDAGKLIALILLYGFITYVVLAIVYYMPFVVENRKLDSTVSGMIISLFFLAVMLPGFFLNSILNTLKGNTNLICLCLIAGGLLIAVTFKSAWLMIPGIIFSGFGYGIMQPLIYNKTADISNQQNVTLALAFVMAVNYLAILVFPFIMDGIKALFHTKSDTFPFYINAIITLLVIIIALFKRDSFAFGLDKKYYTNQ